jgi:hypothetical protein
MDQKQTFSNLRRMFALPPNGTQSWNVRFVPIADIACLLDKVFDPVRSERKLTLFLVQRSVVGDTPFKYLAVHVVDKGVPLYDALK